jgi:hypothetical protein
MSSMWSTGVHRIVLVALVAALVAMACDKKKGAATGPDTGATNAATAAAEPNEPVVDEANRKLRELDRNLDEKSMERTNQIDRAVEDSAE